jgi:hypothetical protein
MSQENLEVVGRLFDLLNRGGADAVIGWAPFARRFFKEDWFGAFPLFMSRWVGSVAG